MITPKFKVGDIVRCVSYVIDAEEDDERLSTDEWELMPNSVSTAIQERHKIEIIELESNTSTILSKEQHMYKVKFPDDNQESLFECELDHYAIKSWKDELK